MNNERFLLCTPRGGLNDALCQIEKCRRYAQQFGRTLVINAEKSGLLGPFSEYFRFTVSDPKIIANFEADLRTTFPAMRCLPLGVNARLFEYNPYSSALKNHIDEQTGTQLTFNFSQDHSEPLILHEQCGGGTQSLELLRCLTFSDRLKREANAALSAIPLTYAAVHIRNTDHKTDYRPFLTNLRAALSGKNVLVCSDDAHAITFAKATLVQSNVFTVTITMDLGGRPLHRRENHQTAAARGVSADNSLIDLIALGRATELHFSKVATGGISGFSRLANALRDNPNVSAQLLS